jgi:hypothetical protein
VNGSVQLVYQCLSCGRATSNPFPRTSIREPDKLPNWDDTIAGRYEQTRKNQKLKERQAWFTEHNEYLNTDQWRSLRARVLQRSRGMCEGCGVGKATEVHHLTYDHWQDELLWELVAVCHHCHEKVHAKLMALVHGKSG